MDTFLSTQHFSKVTLDFVKGIQKAKLPISVTLDGRDTQTMDTGWLGVRWMNAWWLVDVHPAVFCKFFCLDSKYLEDENYWIINFIGIWGFMVFPGNIMSVVCTTIHLNEIHNWHKFNLFFPNQLLLETLVLLSPAKVPNRWSARRNKGSTRVLFGWLLREVGRLANRKYNKIIGKRIWDWMCLEVFFGVEGVRVLGEVPAIYFFHGAFGPAM